MTGVGADCKEFACLALATQIGIIISAILAVLVGALTYWYAFIRPRLHKAIHNSEQRELERAMVRRPHSPQGPPSASTTDESDIRRSQPRRACACESSTERSVQPSPPSPPSPPRPPRPPQTPGTYPLTQRHGIAHVVGPKPPSALPSEQIVGILPPAPPNLSPFSRGLPTVPHPPEGPTLQRPEPGQVREQRPMRLPSMAHATTIADDVSDRTVVPDSLAAEASHPSSTSLDRESRSRLQDLVDRYTERSPVDIDDSYTPEVPHPIDGDGSFLNALGLLNPRGESRIVHRRRSKRRSSDRAFGIDGGISESRVGGPNVPSSPHASIASPSSSVSGGRRFLADVFTPGIETYDSVRASATDRYPTESRPQGRGCDQSSSRGSERNGPTRGPRRSISTDSFSLVSVWSPGLETRDSVQNSHNGRYPALACPCPSCSSSRDCAGTSTSQLSSTGAICSYEPSSRSDTEPDAGTR